MNASRKAAVFLMLGQSNATGHDVPMEEADKITTPLSHVFGLSRGDNQTLGLTSLTWSGYTSAGMNLGEEQDDTYSIPNCLAAAWQKAIDSGAHPELPDLYVVHIAIGAQGVSEGYMWNPGYPEKLVPGRLGIADIALYPFSLRVLSLVKKSLEERGLEPQVIGLHWRGGEEDITIPVPKLETYLPGLYEVMLNGFRDALGCPAPIVLHRILCKGRADELDPTGGFADGMAYVNAVFDEMAVRLPDVSVFDHAVLPHYKPEYPRYGIFKEDLVHYTPETNRCVADGILSDAAAYFSC